MVATAAAAPARGILNDYGHDKRPAGVFGRDDITHDTVIGCDVVIVGSGAGGATLAAELAEGGLDVVVVEEGSYWGTVDFGPDAAASIRRMYRNGGATAALGWPPILYQEGRLVGGSSVLNGAMSWRTPERILDRWAREEGVHAADPASMEPFFARVERRIHVAYQDPETIGRDNALLKEGADRKGWKVIPNRRNQLHCAGSNNCAFGCPTGAKQSTLVTYIPRALHFGARIYSDVRVDRIVRSGKRATGITGRVVRADRSPGPRVTVRAHLVVSACGSIHTPALLARSGFRSPSGQLGRNLTMHPNVKVVAIFDEDVRGWEGVHQAFQVREFRDEGLLFAAVNVPPSVLALGLPHTGAALGEVMADYKRTVVAGLLLEDTRVGRVRILPGGKPQAFYQLATQDIDRLKRGLALLSDLLFEAGAKRIILPVGGVGELRGPDDIRKIFRSGIPRSSMEVLTVHLMGTARMGGDRTRAVTDSYGHVYDADRLMITDASLFPTPIGVNPAETIQALATRNAAHILDNTAKYIA